ncbi:MAG TPA: hypothetical protein VE914_00915 [Candidatus Angelobacter sp.]|nr:hypothetical protein [Candidatus Angelobacter sp.]
MQEAGSPTPENGSASFDVKTSDAGGRGRGVLLDGATLGWNSGETRRRRAFDDIASIAFESVIGGDADFARCDFRFADGVDLTVELNNPDTVADILAYRSFVLRLFELLSPAQRARIDFRHGYRRSTQTQMLIAGIFGVAAFLGLFVFELSSQELHAEENWWVLLPLTLLGAALCGWWTRHVLRSSQKTFDPETIPKGVLPPDPRPRRPRKPG